MYPRNLGVISRSTLVDLKNTTQKTFFEICEIFGLHEGDQYTFDRHEQRLKFDNGSEIIFTGLDDIAKIKGMEPGRFYVDEVDEVDPSVFSVFQRRLRNKYAKRRVGFITSNSEGKNWTYQQFIKGQGVPEAYRKYYYTIRASSLENKFLPEDYIDSLLSYEDDLFKRYVLAEFNVFEGQIYDELTEGVHIIDDFDVPQGWDIAYGLDHGLSNPTAIIEGRIDHDGNLYITWEHYKPGQNVSFHAGMLKDRWREIDIPVPPQPTISADPSIFSKTQLPTPEKPFPWSVADEYSEQGISLTRGNNEVLAGINRIKELLKLNKIYIFKSCKTTIDEMQNYRWEKSKDGISKKEAPVKKYDHACDALRYMVMMKMGPSKRIQKAGYTTIEDLMRDDIAMTSTGRKSFTEQDDDII